MKVQYQFGHKWYTEYGHSLCPKCGEPPIAEKTFEETHSESVEKAFAPKRDRDIEALPNGIIIFWD